MNIEKRRLFSISSLLLSLFGLALCATPCYKYDGNFGQKGYFKIFDFGFGNTVSLEVVTIILVSLLLLIALFAVFCFFFRKLSDLIVGIANISAWTVALGFTIASMCSKYMNPSITMTNSVTFILLACILGIAASIFILVKQQERD